MSEPDELYTLRNRFWLGNFQLAIAEGNNLMRLSEPLRTERDEFVYRCYVGLGQYNLVLSEIKATAPVPLQAIKMLATYLQNPKGSSEMVLMTLREWLNDTASCNNSTVQLVAAIIYEKEAMMKDAFCAIRHGTTMEQLALCCQFLLKIQRPDLASKQLKKMQEMDEDATLTQLSSAWVNLTLGGVKYKEAAYAYEELIDKFEPSLALLNGLACVKMQMGEFEEAEKHLVHALTKGGSDPDTLINVVTCYAHMGKPAEVVDRYQQQLEQAAPDHPHVQKLRLAMQAFDRVAEQMQGNLGTA